MMNKKVLKKVDEKILLLSIVGTLEAVKDGGITIDEAEKLMSGLQIRRIPVCDTNNKIVGIISLGDLAHHGKEVGTEHVCNTLENICNCNGNTKNAE